MHSSRAAFSSLHTQHGYTRTSDGCARTLRILLRYGVSTLTFVDFVSDVFICMATVSGVTLPVRGFSDDRKQLRPLDYLMMSLEESV